MCISLSFTYSIKNIRSQQNVHSTCNAQNCEGDTDSDIGRRSNQSEQNQNCDNCGAGFYFQRFILHRFGPVLEIHGLATDSGGIGFDENIPDVMALPATSVRAGLYRLPLNRHR
jgi:hypothetical protein